jgi:hypothetical protein
MTNKELLVTDIVSGIFYVRGQKVMPDNDLASIYVVETKVLNQAVKRNLARFPKDFFFQVTAHEWESKKGLITVAARTPLTSWPVELWQGYAGIWCREAIAVCICPHTLNCICFTLLLVVSSVMPIGVRAAWMMVLVQFLHHIKKKISQINRINITN